MQAHFAAIKNYANAPKGHGHQKTKPVNSGAYSWVAGGMVLAIKFILEGELKWEIML